MQINAYPEIVMENVIKKFDDINAVDNVSLRIARGEMFGLLGPNGAGKTTIVNILCGLIKPTSGFVTVGGYSLPKNLEDLKRIISLNDKYKRIQGIIIGRALLEGKIDLKEAEKIIC
ncbi:MAG: ATP-binding cassette domain-containing protein [Nitrososphaeria archaeon]